MKLFFTFFKKEIREQLKNFKILVIFSVMLIFAISSPIMAKLTPEILKNVDLGVKIDIPIPTYIDSFVQFFQNLTQMCIIVILLVFGGNISNEISKGTANLLFAKGLTRTKFLLSKFSVEVLIWTVGLIVSIGVFYGYTVELFPDNAPKNVFLSFFCIWLLVVFFLALLTFMSAVFSQGFAPLLSTVGVIIVLLILNAFPQIAKKSPMVLGSCNLDLIKGNQELLNILFPLVFTGGLTILILCFALLIFNRKEI